MAETVGVLALLKRWAWVWPILVAAVTLVGFQIIPPEARTSKLEAQVAALPESLQVRIEARVHPIEAEIGRLQAEQFAQRTRDSVAGVRLDRIERIGTVGVAIQCASLTPRELTINTDLADVCQRTRQRAGLSPRTP